MNRTETRICPLCQEARKEFVALWDDSEICAECFAVARIEKKERPRAKQLNPLDKDKVFEPKQCCKCKRWIAESKRWVYDSSLCRKCHRNLQFGLDPPGAYFIDERGRVIQARKDPTRPKFAYGVADLPRSRVVPLNDAIGALAFAKQVDQCWEAVVQWRPYALYKASRFPNPEELVSDVGYHVIGRCKLLNENDDTFKAYLASALLRAYRRHSNKEVAHLELLEFDAPQASAHAGLDAADELQSLGLDEDDRYLLEQRLLYGRTFSSLAEEYGLTAAGVGRRFRALMKWLQPT